MHYRNTDGLCLSSWLMKGLQKPMHDMCNAICRHKSKSGAAKSVAMADVSEALHYSKQTGKRPSCESFWYKRIFHIPFLSSRHQVSQKPKSQYMKRNFEFRKDPTHAKKFYKIVPQKWYDSYWAIHWVCCEKQWISFQAFVYRRGEKGLLIGIENIIVERKKWKIEKTFWSGNAFSVWLCTNLVDWFMKIDSSSKPLLSSIEVYSFTFCITKKEISSVREWSEFSI